MFRVDEQQLRAWREATAHPADGIRRPSREVDADHGAIDEWTVQAAYSQMGCAHYRTLAEWSISCSRPIVTKYV